MGGTRTHPQGLKWVCWALFCALLLHANTRVSADSSQEDSDLVFDNLDLPNLKHHRIAREVSSSYNEAISSQPEEDNWLTRTVNKVKRSIGSLFSNEEHAHLQKNHHQEASIHQYSEDSHSKVARNSRQIEYDEPDEEDDYGQEEDDTNTLDGQFEDNHDETNFYGNKNDNIFENFQSGSEDLSIGGGPGVDDEEDDADDEFGSGKDGGSGEIVTSAISVEPPENPEISSTTYSGPPHPVYYRFLVTVAEFYQSDFEDRDSEAFQELARKMENGVRELFSSKQGDQQPTVISIEKDKTDNFKMGVTVDLKSIGWYDSQSIENFLYQHVRDQRRIGDAIVTPDNFKFRPFEECEEHELTCNSKQCVDRSARCNGIRECNDNSDEIGCPSITTTTSTTAATPRREYESPTTSTILSSTTTTTEIPDIGSGDGDFVHRADDVESCADGTGSYYGDQKCDGTKQCLDGSDEENCMEEDKCAQGEFSCDLTRCLPLNSRCDGLDDCTDKTDEQECEMCTESAFHCDNTKCILKDQVCDHFPNCRDGTDERECSGGQVCDSSQFSCGNGQCISNNYRCTGRAECSNGADERNCGRLEDAYFRCGSGEHILKEKRCDREYDCADQSDEKQCPCLDTDFFCNSGICIPYSQRCDGIRQCQDQSDEFNCEKHRCEHYQWPCKNGQCIDITERCNNIVECSDGSDEQNCTFCKANTFRCSNGTCVSLSQHCDGIPDCPHSEDEENCEHNLQCFPGLWKCEDGLKCINNSRLCDGVRDCGDQSDENVVNCYWILIPGFDTVSEDTQQSCAAVEFTCADGSCVYAGFRCDGVYDCPDDSDERGCDSNEMTTTTRPHLPSPCYPNQIQCRDGTCVNGARCDRTYDCLDGTDEENCQYCEPSMFQCRSGGCIDLRLKCDRLNDCKDGSDEENCECRDHEFDCGEGVCVDLSMRCDQHYDCPRGNDEINCDGSEDSKNISMRISNHPCTEDEFHCGGGECISLNLRCDLYTDCKNSKADEENCDCQHGEFRCPDGECIPQLAICDGNGDCSDNSDEANCRRSSCSFNEFRCERDNQCIPSYQRCDRNWNCADGSDEVGCDCLSHEFQCSNGQCVDQRVRCNGRPDCSDYSDEYLCPVTTEASIPFPPVTVAPTSCPFGYVSCLSEDQCILQGQLCDGRVDCLDMSDESRCEAGADGLQLRTYPSQQDIKENRFRLDQEVVFQCRDEGPIRARVEWRRANGLPLPPGSRDLNGRLEMPNIKVEHGGTYVCVAKGYPPGTPGAEIAVQLHVDKVPEIYIPPPVKCFINESTCANGDCISRNKVCDGQFDCSDGSDEIRCRQCEPNEFKCDNKKCVSAVWKCDGQDDCSDGSDERFCQASILGQGCGAQQYTCRNDQCVPRSFHCDGYPDCIDKSDEIGCTPPVIAQGPPSMVTLSVGQTFTITCRAVGVPTPQIMWRLNWHHVPSKCRMTSVDGFGTLICENIQMEDQGAYSCEALSSIKTVFASVDTILTVTQRSPCRAGYFNVEARAESECIKCFCFGHTSNCRSADLFIFQFQPPFDSLKLLGARIDPRTGVVDIRDEPIYKGVEPVFQHVGTNGVVASLPFTAELNQRDVVPYFALPENYNGNQLKSYGGYLKYTVLHGNSGRPIEAPDVIVTGNNYILLHESRTSPQPHRPSDQRVRFFEGDWIIKSESQRPRPATREEIMMVLEDVSHILIKLEYNGGLLNTTLSNIEMDSAAIPDSGLGIANYVEECSCPVGYTGTSCESCADGFSRHQSGQWLGQCYKEPQDCQPGSYFDGRECQVCPCPYTSPSNQFARTCRLNTDGNVVCDCQQGYTGLRCEHCAPGFVGNPLQPGDYCRPSTPCDPQGTLGQDIDGRCLCKEYTTGSFCNQCKPNTFYLSSRNQFGCISCFCMGVSQQCTSSNWYRDTIGSVFTSSTNEFRLTGISKEDAFTQGLRLNQDSRELLYSSFAQGQPDVYYWALPNKYLGDKVTSYGGYLKYTIRNTPVPGGASSRNNAPDVELVSANRINLQYFANQTQSTNAPQSFEVPLLEQYWQRNDGVKTDREHLLMALADVQGIYIKATYYTNTQEAALISVSLDTAVEHNTGRERAFEVEQCYCPPGHTGLSCEDCAFGYTRSDEGIYLELCVPCECNGYSNECDPETGVCRNCRNNTAGDQCDQCLPGFTREPNRGQCVPHGHSVPCSCDPKGSTYLGCTNGVCQCKANVEGPNCDRCRKGTFGLSADNIEGCEFCFCSGVSTECSQSQLYVEQIPVQITDDHGFILTDQYFRETIKSDFKTNLAMNEIGYNFRPSIRERMYWSLPSIFTGNQIKSYGGKLEYMQRYIELPHANYFLDKDIIITGNNVVIYWTNPIELRPEIVNSVSARIHPSANWNRLDQNRAPKSASREDILTVLANIDTILIRATPSTDTSSTFLSDITLDTAVEVYTAKPLATSVETCRCPPGYRGTSCESCASGYYRDLSYSGTNPLGSCRKCPCTEREESCQFDQSLRGVVCYCLPGYTGRYCEQISPAKSTKVQVVMSPPRVVAPIGKQVFFVCTYRTEKFNPDLHIIIENESTGLRTEIKDLLHYPGGAQASFYGIVGCVRHTIRCIIENRIHEQLGWVDATLIPAEIITTTRRPNHIDPTPFPPSIEVVITGHNIEIYQIGSSLRLNCSAISRISQSTLRVDWSKDSDRLPYHAIDDGTGILLIRNLTASDSGRYICRADDGFSVVTESIVIVVGEGSRDVAPTMVLSEDNITANEGQLIEIRCSATGNPSPEFFLSRIDRQVLNPTHTFENGVFRILQARATDAGQYQCTAINRVGQDSKTFEVQVTSGSIIQVKIDPPYFDGQTGDEIVLRCIAERAQNIRWSKDNGPLPYQYRDQDGVLIIPNAQPSDSGRYICTATSYDGTRGSQYSTVNIRGGGGVRPSVRIVPDTLTLRQGERSDVKCEALGVPTPSVKWSKVNGVLGGGVEQRGNNLQITNAKIENRGVYVCVVSNDYGMEQASARIEVTRFEAPLVQILPEGGTISVTSGNTAQLQCRVINGYPAPTVTWSRENGRPLSSNVEILTGGNFRIIDITPTEGGEYVCSATNEAGTATAVAHITVYIPPRLTTTPKQDTITKAVNDHLQLACYGTGEPQPSVSWVKSTSPEYYKVAVARGPGTSDSAFMEFTHLRPDDAGVYVCIGRNEAGVVERRVQLDILPERGDNPGGDQGFFPSDHVQEFVAITGNRAELRCSVNTSHPENQYFVDWVRPNEQHLPPDAYSTQGNLFIDNVQPSAEGEYECITYELPHRNVLFRLRSRLRVLSPPRITLHPIRQVVAPGQNAYIRCNATGDQPIDIHWVPVNRTLPSSVYTADGYIRFNNIHHSDAGNYRCVARNSAGEADSVSEVVVAYEPEIHQPSIETENHRVTSAPGNDVSLRCRRGLGTESYPVTWNREGAPLPDNARLDGPILRIFDLRKDNEGRYFCEIETPGGLLSDYVFLDVSAGPRANCMPGWWRCANGNCISEDMVCNSVDDCDDGSDESNCARNPRGPSVKSLPELPALHITPETRIYQEGTTIDINCQSNEPGVIPVWAKLGGGLADNVQNRAGRLTIHNARSENSGSYRCEATGQQGNYYKDHDLSIKAPDDPLRDEVPLQVQRAKRGATVMLECSSDLEPPVTYFWSKQGGSLPYYVDEYSKTITLNSVGAIDAGTYICSVTNQRRTLDVPIVLVVTGIIPYFTQAPNSYVTLPTLADAYLQFSFEISFKPENDHGLILYNGNRDNDRDGDFISLALDNGVPEFRFNLGPGTPTTAVRGNKSVADREWHTIKVVRNKKRVIMFVDGKGPFIGENEGKYFGLDLSEPLFLGGVPNYNNISPEMGIDTGLVGCISKFKIGYVYQDILHDSLNSSGITNCETCTESKCQNQGTCQEALTTEGYTCICPPKFSGSTCNKRKGEACSPYSCGIGKCTDTDYSFVCQCPLGRSGRQCEKTVQVYEPAFRDNAYIAYPPPRPLKRTKIEMRIKPRKVDDALLLYAAETNEGHGDFVSLTIKDKHLEFRFDNGKGPVVIRSDQEIQPNKWTTISAIRAAQDGRIIVNGHPSAATRFSAFFKTLTLLTPLYVGGYDQYSVRLNQGVKVKDGFNGCIVDINISGLDDAMMKNITDSSNVEDCGTEEDIDNGIPTGYLDSSVKPVSYDNRKTGCSDEPCKNNALCTPLSPVEYKCICPAAFSGKNCDIPIDLCKDQPCRYDGICRQNATGFTCDCPLGYGGFTCEQRIELRNDAHFDGNSWLAFSKNLLPHRHESEPEIIALELSTNKSNGLIFWHGQNPQEDGQGQDYISLALSNGYLEFSYDLGSGPAILNNTQVKVDDGERHSIILKREGRSGSIDVDHTYLEEGKSEGRSTTLDCNGNIYLGGTPNVTKMTGGRFASGFEGCIHGFELQQSKTLDLGMKAIDGLNVKPCSSFSDIDNNIWNEELIK
ncbi:basement membrane-specific heparan sulfate proteoglycan core protein isoform X1 [Euwallacea similis]|uniref:basement membrane-specific heparan sulfate proteoglycan core protein isoform X1 n=1 Tax=Euwallacea similis TaxID=1736056 RepID=UPI003450115C